MAQLKAIAERTGFSISVVSRVLNRRPDKNARVAPATRRLIENTARELGFRRNRMAEFMKRGSSPTIGVFLPVSSNRLIVDLVFGVSEVLAVEGFPIQIHFSDYDHGFHAFIRHNIDYAHSGIISYPMLLNDAHTRNELADYQRKGGRIVLLNSPLRMAGTQAINIDNRLGGQLAAERLLARRCARFAMIGDYCRRQGFAETLAQAGATASFFPDEPQARAQLAELCREATVARPMGIFAAADMIALRVMNTFADTSLRVGREVLLIGYDDLDFAAETKPPLTTIHQPFREAGQLAARRIMAMIYGERESEIQIPPKLVVRESA